MRSSTHAAATSVRFSGDRLEAAPLRGGGAAAAEGEHDARRESEQAKAHRPASSHPYRMRRGHPLLSDADAYEFVYGPPAALRRRVHGAAGPDRARRQRRAQAHHRRAAPAQALQSLDVDPLDAQIRQVFFFDTPDLALNSAGVVVRARRVQGKGDDTVVKLRPVVPESSRSGCAARRTSASRSTRCRAASCARDR